jgi:hypothetical protein
MNIMQLFNILLTKNECMVWLRIYGYIEDLIIISLKVNHFYKI